jgi:hypothetical protein
MKFRGICPCPVDIGLLVRCVLQICYARLCTLHGMCNSLQSRSLINSLRTLRSLRWNYRRVCIFTSSLPAQNAIGF